MDTKLKRKWVKALRSGEYEQAKTFLMDSKGAMCCLGVLAHIQGAAAGKLSGKCTTTLPVGFNAGLRKAMRKLLGRMNDGSGGCEKHDFGMIADYIENHL